MPEQRGLLRYVRLILDRESSKKTAAEMEQTLARAGEVGGQAFLRELRQEFDTKMADLRTRLARGLIDRNQFDQEARAVAQSFNTRLSAAVIKLREEGRLTDREFQRLSRSFKNVGDVGTSAFGRIRTAMGSLLALVGVGSGVLAILKLVDFLKDSNRAAIEFDTAIRKLDATARITGTSLEFLETTAAQVKASFGLSTTLANDLTIELAKLTSKAGDVRQTGAAVAAFLDIGAARGLDAAQTLQAVAQAIIGIDEGTDKLFNKNPSVLYEEFAKSIGTTGGKLSETGKAVAILDAAFRDGEKVRGEYLKWLDSAQGKQFTLGVRIEEMKAKLGHALQPALLAIIPALTTAVGWFSKLTETVHLTWLQFDVWEAKIQAAVTRVVAGIARNAGQLAHKLSEGSAFIRRLFGVEDGGGNFVGFGLIQWANEVDETVTKLVSDVEANLERVKKAYADANAAAVGPIGFPPFAPDPSSLIKPDDPDKKKTKEADRFIPTGVGLRAGPKRKGPFDPFAGLKQGMSTARAELRFESQMMANEVAENFKKISDEATETGGLMEAALIGAAMRITDQIAQSLELVVTDLDSLPDAAVGIGAGIIAGLSQGMAEYHTAQGIGKLAEGTWPPNPAAIKSAFGHFAAAAAFKALGGIIAKAAQGGGRGGGTSAPSGARDGSRGTDRMRLPPTIIYQVIDGFDPDNGRHLTKFQRGRINADQRWGNQKPTGRLYVTRSDDE